MIASAARGGVALMLAAVLSVSVSYGQEVRGVVVEDDAGVPISGATVQLLAADSAVRATAVTNAAGWFRLSVAAGGAYRVRVSHALYTNAGDVALTVHSNELVNVVLRMGRGAIPLEPLVVAARSRDRLSGFRARASGHGQGRYLSRPEIERRNPTRPTDIFRMEPSVRLERLVIQDVWTEVLMMRSLGDDCEPAIYIDGFPLPPRVGMSGISIDDLLTVDDVEGVEIYSSHLTAPLELHVPQDACGVIALWTRPGRGRPHTWKRVAVGALLAGMILLLY
jgi:hypothetical protein